MSADVVIVRTGAANLASVVAAFERLGSSVQITDNERNLNGALWGIFEPTFAICDSQAEAQGIPGGGDILPDLAVKLIQAITDEASQ